jgi:predicted metalloprotease
MRLNRFNPANIRVRGGGGGGLGGGAPLGCGAVVIAIVGALVFGVDPGQMLGAIQQVQQGAPAEQGPQGQTAEELCGANQYALESCNALSSLNQTWQPIFAASNVAYHQPELVFYTGGTRSGCGAASSAMGPFYCPSDEGIYIDTSFYDEMARQLGAPGDFARYYGMAHEYGHHVQRLTGTADAVRKAQQSNPGQANQLQVRMELQADCYAGVWAAKNRNLIEPGDFEEGMTAASAIGDDTLSGGRAAPESFTHGTSAQRMEWLRRGLTSGNEDQCDTFADLAR